MEVVYEDNHIIIVSKQAASRLCKVTRPATNRCLRQVKEYIKEDVRQAGECFLGVPSSS
jgi:23S rRNA-/tRNA-specific pseudouridylate synthase